MPPHSIKTCQIIQIQIQTEAKFSGGPKRSILPRLFSSSNISERILIVKISLVHCDEVDTNSLDFHSSFHKREEAPEQDLLFDVHLYLSYFGRRCLSFFTHKMFPSTISLKSHDQNSSLMNFWKSPPAR